MTRHTPYLQATDKGSRRASRRQTPRGALNGVIFGTVATGRRSVLIERCSGNVVRLLFHITQRILWRSLKREQSKAADLEKNVRKKKNVTAVVVGSRFCGAKGVNRRLSSCISEACIVLLRILGHFVCDACLSKACLSEVRQVCVGRFS